MKALQELLFFSGSTCLITGAANGIGTAIARRFAEAGADLVLVDVDERNLNKVSRSLSSFKVNVRVMKTDLSNKNEIDALWEQIKDIEVDILVNNAGIYPFHDFLSLTETELARVMHVNLYAVLWMCQHFIKRRGSKGGAIVNIGSIEAIMPFKKGLTHYSVAKTGVISLTRDLAREFAGKKIRVNAVLPGGIKTKGTMASAIKALKSMDVGLVSDGYNFKQRIPAGKLGHPDDVAKMVLMLASDIAGYVHGALVPVDGGFLSA